MGKVTQLQKGSPSPRTLGFLSSPPNMSLSATQAALLALQGQPGEKQPHSMPRTGTRGSLDLTFGAASES